MESALLFLLVASADEPLRTRLGGILRPAGFAVLKASTAEEALRQALAPVRLAVVEGALLSVCPHLRAEPLLKGLRILALSDTPVPDADLSVPRDLSADDLLRHVKNLLHAAPPPLPRPALILIRDLINGFSSQVVLLDARGTIVAANASWRQFTAASGGAPKAVNEGANYFDACTSQTPETEAFVAGIQQVLAGKRKEFVHEYTCHFLEDFRWLRARVSRLVVGDAVYLLVAHENVTTRQRIEEARQQTDQSLSDTLVSVADGIALLDPDGRVTFSNPAIESCLGRRRHDLAQQPLWQILPELLSAGLPRLFEQARGSRSSLDLEVFLPETGRWLAVYGCPTRDGMLLHFRDVTRPRAAREADSRRNAERLDQLQREGDELRQLVAVPRHKVAGRLREAASELFQQWVKQYEEILEQALEQRAYRVAHLTSQQLRELADRLGFAGAGPRDVIDLHKQALQSRTRHVTASRAYSYIEEGRLLLVELLGDLVSYYRARTVHQG